MLASAERVGTLPGLVRRTQAIPVNQTLVDLDVFEVMGNILIEHRRRYPNDRMAKVEGLYQVHLPLRFLDRAVGLGVKTIDSLLPPKLSTYPNLRRVIEEWQTAGSVAGVALCFGQTEVTNRFLPHPQSKKAAVAVLPDADSELGLDVRYTYGLNWNSLNQMSKGATGLHPLASYHGWDIERRVRYGYNLAIPKTGLISKDHTVAIGSSCWQLTQVNP